MKNKTLFNSLLFSFSLLGSFFVLNKPLKAENAPVCPDPEKITISSVYNLSNENDPNSFYGLTGGFCRGTPDKYGVKVFKMGFCKKNPGNPTGSSILEGEGSSFFEVLNVKDFFVFVLVGFISRRFKYSI